VKILNAEKYVDYDIACYLKVTNQLKPVPLVARYESTEKSLHIFALKDKIRFSDIHSIHFGKSGELNVCSQEHFKYKVADGQDIDLVGKSNTALLLNHIAAVLPDIRVTLKIMLGGIVNIKWTWADNSTTGKVPFEVPQDYVTPLPLQGDLSKSVRINPSPFQISFVTVNDVEPTEFFRLEGMIFEDYLNWIKVTAFTEQGENFRGVFGLGERATTDFFFKSGVYSMWAKDNPTPID